jgi:hypothetical protein
MSELRPAVSASSFPVASIRRQSVRRARSQSRDRKAVAYRSRDALAGVIVWQAPRIVYVSCDSPTLARDATHLRDAGSVLQSIAGVDLFPNTPHVETVAVFDRTGAPGL